MTQAAGTKSRTAPRIRRGPVLITIALGVLLNPLNSSMIAVALNRLEHVFHLDFSTASWLISAYYLASAIAQPVMGKVSDFVGRKKVYLIGLVLVAISSFTASFAPSFGWLIAFRLIQSFGSGAIYPAGMGIVRHHITERQSQALAVLSVFASGAAAFGPSIGGFLVHYGDWPAIFWVNFPFVIASFVLALWTLPADPRRRERRASAVNAGVPTGAGTAVTSGATASRAESVSSPALAGEPQHIRDLVRQLDIPGIVLFSALIVCSLLFLLSLTRRPEWGAGVIALAALGGFVLLELRSPAPFIDLRMFRRNRGLMWVLLQFVTVNVIFYSIFFGMPQFLQEARGFNSQQTGLLMLAVAGFGVIIAPLTGRWVARSGVRPPLLLAGVCMTTGSTLFWTIHERTPVWWLVICLAVLGLSNGFNNVGLQTALFRVTPKAIIGTASGLFQTSRYLGTILSSVLLGLFFGNHLDTPSLHALGTVLAILGLVVIWMSWRLPARRQDQKGDAA